MAAMRTPMRTLLVDSAWLASSQTRPLSPFLPSPALSLLPHQLTLPPTLSPSYIGASIKGITSIVKYR